MQPTQCLKIKIHDVKITFYCNNNKELIKFIKRDFYFFESDHKDDSDIRIEIKHDEFKIPENTTYFNDSILSFKETIAIKYNARFRQIWVTFSTKPYLGNNIKIYIPKKLMMSTKRSKIIEKVFRMLFPNFLYRWQNALIDIIHGPILGLIHLRLLTKGAAFLHTSAVSDEYGNGVALPGWAQSGKSTIADILIRKEPWKLIAEDLCIVTKDKKIISFPKQRRVYYHQLKNTNYYKIKRSIAEQIQDRFNTYLFRFFSVIGLKSKRILTTDEIYKKNSIALSSDLGIVVYLLRGDFDDIRLYEVQPKKMAEMCSSMMLAEIQNFNGFYQLLAINGIVSDDENLIQFIANKTHEQYMSSFKDRKCYILKAPYLENLEFVNIWLHHKLEDIISNKLNIFFSIYRYEVEKFSKDLCVHGNKNRY